MELERWISLVREVPKQYEQSLARCDALCYAYFDACRYKPSASEMEGARRAFFCHHMGLEFVEDMLRAHRAWRESCPVASTLLICVGTGRSLWLRQNYGRRLWTLPGGKVDPGETFIEAAARELFEETGSRTAYYHTDVFRDFRTKKRPIRVFFKFVEREFSPVLDPKEHFSWKWHSGVPSPTHRELEDLVKPDVPEVPENAI